MEILRAQDLIPGYGLILRATACPKAQPALFIMQAKLLECTNTIALLNAKS